MTYEIIRQIEKERDFAIKLLCDLIRVRTVVPPGNNYKDFVNIIADNLREMGIQPRIEKVPKELVEKVYPEMAEHPRYIVLCKIGRGKPVFHLNGHYDVVPGGSGWFITKPFEPKVINDEVYGRGAADMKGGIVSMILALKSLIKIESKLNGTLEVSFTPDEEIGGETGVGYMLKSGISKPNFCIIGEPSGVNNVWFGHKGALWLKVIVEGTAAHGSTPWMGINAFEKMVWVANEFIAKLKPRIESKVSKYEYVIPEGKRATICIGGVVEGGAKINMVPDQCAFTVDRRIIPEESVKEALNEISEFIEHLKGLDPELKIKIKILQSMEPCVTDPKTSELCRETVRAISSIIGESPKLSMCIGGLDLRYFVEHGAQAIAYGPGDMDQAHKSNERVTISNILKVAKVYVTVIHKLLIA